MIFARISGVGRKAAPWRLAVPLLAGAAGGVLAILPAGAGAQEMTSREVVQPLPSGEVQRLNRALMQLARDPRDLAALLEAGEASLAVDDFEAATGFFARAAAVEPDNPRAATGLARVYLQSGDAPRALDQFGKAEAAGIPADEIIAERALALDLVGDQAGAQAAYTRALVVDPRDDETRRRLALSFAISGNRANFEDTLRPLLDQRDAAALRVRAFGLAIFGDQQRAAAIVEQVMPRDLSSRLIPYLEFMPRLTGAQQAAAANLGIFPRAADIGRDDPRLARFAREGQAGSRLAPSGAPLGSPAAARGAEPDGDASRAPRGGRNVAAASPSQPGVLPSSARSARRAAERNRAPAPVAAPAPERTAAPAAAPAPAAEPQVATVLPAPVPAQAPAQAPMPAPVPVVAAAPAPVPAAAAASAPVVAPQPQPQPQPAPAPAPAQARVADAFADLTGPLPDARVGSGAVDLAQITPPIEVAAKPEPKPKPAKPVHPSRHWVQIATGRDVGALAFDWRRLSRKGGDLFKGLEPHTTRWGQANRLLAGPVASGNKARDIVNALKEKGIDAFSYTSPQGEEIQPLK